MARIESRVSVNTAGFRANAARMQALVDQAYDIAARAHHASSGQAARFEKRGQILPRSRVALLLDPGTPFLEIAALAGYRMDRDDAEKSVPGGGIIAGIGVVAGRRVMVCASDSGIAAGALQPGGLDKHLRVQEIALENNLPFVQLVESAGANLMAYRVEDFVRGGNLFRNLALMSARGLPVITVTHGSSTAGGAYQTGLADHIVMVRGRTRAFLAGPPLLKAATGEIAEEEELGGAEMHTGISGLGDYLAEDDAHAIGIARDIIAHIDWLPGAEAPRPWLPPASPPETMLGLIPPDHRTPVDMAEVIARIVDGSEFTVFGDRYGSATLCGTGMVEGWPLGIITNNGPIDEAGAAKATHFIQACCQTKVPILYLNNTTGFMVGRRHEEAGIIKHGSKMIQAVTNATVPQFTVFCGASFGAGNYGMCGRGFHPRFAFSWPNARTAVMGGEQAAGTMRVIAEGRAQRLGEAVDEEALEKQSRRIIDNFDRQMDAFYTSARVLDDGVIDPRETRAVLALVMRITREARAARPVPMQFAVARP
ncbi:acetyl-CoA carboxylase [Haematobacter massiliensis]|uniref:Acetyl-CoA carboxylase n=1 Tax=Haematobacter massiliensis TaxID=195105 RepID=A0A086Y2A8_9RHOB|nr:carboxyl transferase domain-containing protein [Haematobacter massiliensis]KFI28408.1 acetyl-CoA carboxylase [Haematobacter massiliensis]OWJ84652.1 acetyl-CoA carboxylase carboxyltransferase subunit [Haematobacter massiliensis]QBJ26383.1 acyl-CoA carboxylase subunit beta [Haematobacter massiliensis]